MIVQQTADKTEVLYPLAQPVGQTAAVIFPGLWSVRDLYSVKNPMRCSNLQVTVVTLLRYSYPLMSIKPLSATRVRIGLSCCKSIGNNRQRNALLALASANLSLALCQFHKLSSCRWCTGLGASLSLRNFGPGP